MIRFDDITIRVGRGVTGGFGGLDGSKRFAGVSWSLNLMVVPDGSTGSHGLAPKLYEPTREWRVTSAVVSAALLGVSVLTLAYYWDRRNDPALWIFWLIGSIGIFGLLAAFRQKHQLLLYTDRLEISTNRGTHVVPREEIVSWRFQRGRYQQRLIVVCASGEHVDLCHGFEPDDHLLRWLDERCASGKAEFQRSPGDLSHDEGSAHQHNEMPPPWSGG